MKYCTNCKYSKNYRLGSTWCQGPQNIVVNYVSSKPTYMAIRCSNERTASGSLSCGREAIYYEPDFLTRAKEFLLGAIPQKTLT
jgi:hypothetical protein